MSEDHGPASKYLGPLTQKIDDIEESLMVVVDDDRFYNKNLLRNFRLGFGLFPDFRFATGDGSLYFERNYPEMRDDFVEFHIRKNMVQLAGFYGFCIRVREMQELVDYHMTILNRVPKSFWHDEGITHAYLAVKGEEVLILKHRGCCRIGSEPPDALCRTTKFSRGAIEEEIVSVTLKEGLLGKVHKCLI